MPEDTTSTSALTSCHDREGWRRDSHGSLLKDCSEGPSILPRPVCHPFLVVVRLRPVKGWESGAADAGASGERPIERITLAQPTEKSLAAVIERGVRSLGKSFGEGRSTFTRKSAGKGAKGAGKRSTDGARTFPSTAELVSLAKKMKADRVDFRGMLEEGSRLHPALSDVQLALVVRYEQCWLPRGYVRGDLVHSATLWPREELTVEVFNWDRRRLERERSTESGREFAQSGTFTVRASREIATSVQLKLGGEAYGEAGGKLSLAGMELPIDVNAKIGARFTSELTTALDAKSTLLSEATRTASDTYRETRKTRVLETAELGRETRTTRKLVNANACHPVTYFTFEVLEDFEVCTSPAQADLVALIPLPDFTRLDEAWVLAHEHPLRAALLDPVYERGFEAAKKLLSARIFRRRVTPPRPPVQSEPSNAQRDTLREALLDLVRGIHQASEKLSGQTMSEVDLAAALNPFDRDHEEAIAAAGRVATRSYFQSVYPGVFDRVRELHASTVNASDAPSTLLLFQRLSSFLQQVLETGLINLVSRPLKLEALPLLLLPFDDCGLTGALDYAIAQLSTLEPAVQTEIGAATLPGGAASESAPAPVQVPEHPVDRAVDDRYGLDLLADAAVEYRRLADHLRENRDYYLTVLHSAHGQASIAEILAACPQAAELVEPRLLGFHGGAAIFPLTAEARSRHKSDLLDAGMDELRKSAEAARVDFVTLPTSGTVTSARVETCTACEDTVDREQRAGARVAEARARQEEARAERHAARLAQDPPLLDDPAGAPTPALAIELRTPAEE